MHYLACCIIFYDSAQEYERYNPLRKVTRTKITIINIYVILHLRMYFVNYDPVFRSYDCILGVEIVRFMQHKL